MSPVAELACLAFKLVKPKTFRKSLSLRQWYASVFLTLGYFRVFKTEADSVAGFSVPVLEKKQHAFESKFAKVATAWQGLSSPFVHDTVGRSQAHLVSQTWPASDVQAPATKI